MARRGHIQTGLEVKEEINTIFQKLKLDLYNSDGNPNSCNYQNLETSISAYLNKARPTQYDLFELMGAVYDFQNNLNKPYSIKVFNAAEELLRTVKMIYDYTLIGITPNYATLGAKEHVLRASYNEIFERVKEAVDSSSSHDENINSILEVFNTYFKGRLDSDNGLSGYLYFDMVSGGANPAQFIQNLTDISAGGNLNQFNITNYLYNAMGSYNGTTITDIPGALSMLEHSNFNIEYLFNESYQLASFFYYIVSEIGQDQQNGYNDELPFWMAFLSAIIIFGLNEDQIQNFTMDQDKVKAIYYLALDIYKSKIPDNIFAYNLYNNFLPIFYNCYMNNDCPDAQKMIAALYSSFDFFAGSSVAGEKGLIDEFFAQGSLIDDSLLDINSSGLYVTQSNLYNLHTASFNSYEEIATAISSIINPTYDNAIEQIRYMTMDMAGNGAPVSAVADHMQFVKGSNIAQLTDSIYTIFNLGENYALFVEQALESMGTSRNPKSSIYDLVAAFHDVQPSTLSDADYANKILSLTGYNYALNSAVFNSQYNALISDISSTNSPYTQALDKVSALESLQSFSPIMNGFDMGQELCDILHLRSTCTSFTSHIQALVAPTVASELMVQIDSLGESSRVVDNHSMVSSIAEILYYVVDGDFVSAIERDMNTAHGLFDNVKDYVKYVYGATTSEIIASWYVAIGGGYVSSMEGARLLAAAIDNNYVQATDISSYDFNALSYRWDSSTYYDIAKTLVSVVTGSTGDTQLIRDLAQDFTASGMTKEQVIEAFADVEGNNGAEITASVYRILGFPYDSAVLGKRILASTVEDYHESDNQVTLTSLAGMVVTAPQEKFLNVCSRVDDVYYVGNSVFYSFQGNNIGGHLELMQDLFTFAGREQARAECGRYLVQHVGDDLYLTTSQPTGVSGNAQVTGCTESLDPALFLAYCDAVFSVVQNIG